MSYKRLYSFEVTKDVKVPVEKILKKEDGTETKIVEETVKKEVHKFFVRKPTRSLRDDAELFKGRKYAEAIKSDLLPAALISKRLINDDGIFSEQEQKEHATLKRQLLDTQASLTKAVMVPEKERNPEQKAEIEKLVGTMTDTRNTLSKYEAAQLSVFDNTVEVYVRNKTIFYYMLFLAFKEEGNKELPFFDEVPDKGWGANYDLKLKKYDEYEELNDPFYNQVINKFIHITTIWFITGEEDESTLKGIIEPVENTSEKVSAP